MATSATSQTSDGPVLSVINKRLRALKKKLNRIELMESSLSQGKSLNPEQLSVLNSKPSILSRIDELTSLLPSLTTALDEELSSLPPPPQHNNNNINDANNDIDNDNDNDNDVVIRGLVELMYYGRLFDVSQQQQQTDFTLLTRAHLERECCLTYDYVTDDVDQSGLLAEADLDLISGLQGLIVSKPGDSIVSHKDAVDLCTQRAKLWIQNAHLPVDDASNVTYAALREKLNKIISSDYVTATPHMKGPGEVAAAAVGNFGLFQVPETMVNVEVPIQVEGSPEQHQQQTEEHAEHAANYEEHETTGHQSGNIEEEFHKDESENPPEVIAVQTDQEQSQTAEGDQGFRNADINDQQYVQRRGQRGGRGGGRRGYSNGRGGGRGNSRGNGPYQNGRNQYNDNYYPRNNYYNRRGGRGGGGNGGGYYNNSSGAQGNYSEANVGVAS